MNLEAKEMALTYISFNESINGVYISQVIDNVLHFKKLGVTAKIIAFFSVRDFINNRRCLKKHIPNAIALPAIGKMKHWKLNRFWFKVIGSKLENQTVICRGPLATNLAINNLRNSIIVYDGRGAVWAEHEEYKVYKDSGIEDELFEMEKNAVLNSDKQIAITSQLINYWKKNYHYNKDTYAVIPCTLNADKVLVTSTLPLSLNSFFNHHKNNIIIVFSGGNGKWQQLDRICSIAEQMIKNQANIAFLFLTPQNSLIEELQTQYNNKVLRLLVAPDQVTPILNKCDYGIVLRENNITNNVASPVKVAEYLAAGLKVIISPHIGDYSKLIKDNELGFTIKGIDIPKISKPTPEDRNTSKAFAERNLTKSSFNYIEFLFS